MIPHHHPTSSPHELCLKWAKPTAVLSKADTRHCLKLCEMSKQFLRQGFMRFVRRSPDEPCLMSYSSDATPLKSMETVVQQFWDVRIIRRGRSAGSWNIQRLWALRGGEQSIMFTEPFKMADHTTLSLYTCFSRLFPTLRDT